MTLVSCNNCGELNVVEDPTQAYGEDGERCEGCHHWLPAPAFEDPEEDFELDRDPD